MKFALLALSLFSSTAVLADTQPYRSFYESLEPLQRIKDLRHVQADARLSGKEAGVAPEWIRMVIKSRSGDIPITVGADGRFTFPLDQRLFEEDPPVESTPSSDLLKLTVTFSARIEPAKSYHYAQFVAVADDYKEGLSRQDFLWRMRAPSFKGMVLRFPKGAEAVATVHLADGALRIASDEKDELRIPDKRAWRKENPRVELSVVPESVKLDL
ncbi:DUF2987 domain-containing protein [Tahibacter amnicola]|uniref:DUF2987 domain-containing protein n=1 Tax=Tahibacter amnicola TaxID=2976241 RepID=A0ABY6BHX4_9GAMM|nr:DUF2987 domain-containing protein [Tahibacter amnicola]UXI67975.1 DUF2987 domain-containing protein [Tahibacter amnicola]